MDSHQNMIKCHELMDELEKIFEKYEIIGVFPSEITSIMVETALSLAKERIEDHADKTKILTEISNKALKVSLS